MKNVNTPIKTDATYRLIKAYNQTDKGIATGDPHEPYGDLMTLQQARAACEGLSGVTYYNTKAV